MKHALWLGLAVLLVGGATGCDDGGTTGPAEKTLEFTLLVPGSIPTKQVIAIEARVTQARLVDYPLTVTFEEANVDQEFAFLSAHHLSKPEETTARITEDAARDPVYRVTVCEAGAAGMCVSRTRQVDVLDFP